MCKDGSALALVPQAINIKGIKINTIHCQTQSQVGSDMVT